MAGSVLFSRVPTIPLAPKDPGLAKVSQRKLRPAYPRLAGGTDVGSGGHNEAQAQGVCQGARRTGLSFFWVQEGLSFKCC